MGFKNVRARERCCSIGLETIGIIMSERHATVHKKALSSNLTISAYNELDEPIDGEDTSSRDALAWADGVNLADAILAHIPPVTIKTLMQCLERGMEQYYKENDRRGLVMNKPESVHVMPNMRKLHERMSEVSRGMPLGLGVKKS